MEKRTLKFNEADIFLSDDIHLLTRIEVEKDEVRQIPYFFNSYDESERFLENLETESASEVWVWSTVTGTVGNIDGGLEGCLAPGAVIEFDYNGDRTNHSLDKEPFPPYSEAVLYAAKIALSEVPGEVEYEWENYDD